MARRFLAAKRGDGDESCRNGVLRPHCYGLRPAMVHSQDRSRSLWPCDSGISEGGFVHLGRLADSSEVAFSTRSGVLRAIRKDDQFQLDFPIIAEEKTEPPPGLIESLNVQPRYIGRNKFDYVVEVESESVVRGLGPDFKQLAAVKCRGVIVTAQSDSRNVDFVSRFFAPAAGIDEDPVTGSAHCCLADFWGKRLGKTEMIGYQAWRHGPC